MTTLDLPFAKRTLPNGLDVIVHEDHHVPIVALNIWYHVGSKNEQPGRTGFAHLFEHLMFEGSEHRSGSYFQPLQQAGGSLNGSTSADRTNYWEVVPSNAIELALWMESDRMGNLLPAVTPERFETQRDVVLNERRQSYENRPYGLASMALASALYPPEHPYSWPTIGTIADLNAMQLEDVHAFYRTYYHPANASLAIAGSIETERAFDLAAQYFGSIPAGPRPSRVTAQASLHRETRLLLEDKVELPRIYMAWLSPAMFEPGDAEMDLLANVLGHGKTSRLYRQLVYERRIALDVSAYQSSREIGGFFVIAATAAPGRSLRELAQVIDEELARMAADGPADDEVQRGVAQAESQFIFQLQTVGGFGGKSDQLNAYNVFRGDPGFLASDVARYRNATSAGVRRAAVTLPLGQRVQLSIVPHGSAHLALADSQPASVA